MESLMSSVPQHARRAPTWRPGRGRGLRIELRYAVLLVWLIVLALASIAFQLPQVLVLTLAAVFSVFYATFIYMTDRSFRAFDREFSYAIARGDMDEALGMYRDARFLRMLTPAYRMLTKFGLLLVVKQRFQAANDVLEEAYEASPARDRGALLGPLVKVKYALGMHDQVVEIASQWRKHSGFPGAPELYLAAGLYGRDGDDASREVERLLDRAEGALGSDERELARRLRTALCRAD